MNKNFYALKHLPYNKILEIEKKNPVYSRLRLYKKPKASPGKTEFYIKLSKPGLMEYCRLNKNPRPRLTQCKLGLISWSQGAKIPLGTLCTYGRHKGKLLWNKNLKFFMCRFLKVKHWQVVRYFNELREMGWIKKVNLNGRPEYRLQPVLLIPGAGEKYLIYKLRGKGRKGFDIFSDLERTYESDKAPFDTAQLRFSINERTRRHRLKKTNQKLSSFFSGRQKKFPYAQPLTLKNNITANGYKGYIFIQAENMEKKKVPWWLCKKIKAEDYYIQGKGWRPKTPAIFFKGKFYINSGGVYISLAQAQKIRQASKKQARERFKPKALDQPKNQIKNYPTVTELIEAGHLPEYSDRQFDEFLGLPPGLGRQRTKSDLTKVRRIEIEKQLKMNF